MGLLNFMLPRVPSDLEATLSAPLASPWSETDHLQTITADMLYGTPDVEAPLTRAEAMRIPSVAKARNLIVAAVSRLPIHSTGSRDALFSGGLSVGLTDQIVMAQIVDDLVFYGRSWVRVTERIETGYPRHVEWLDRSRVQVTERGHIVDGELVPGKDLIRFDSPLPGLLESGRDALRILRDLERASGESGYVVPNLILKQTGGGDDLTPDEVRELVAQWSNARKRKGGSVGFVNDAIDVEVLDQSRENLLIAAQNWSVLQIARLTGLPAHLLDAAVDGAALNYVNVQARNRELLESLSPYMECIEQTFSLFLPSGQRAKFDTTELVIQDRAGRYAEYAAGIAAGFLTIDEVRAMEGLEPLPVKEIHND